LKEHISYNSADDLTYEAENQRQKQRNTKSASDEK